MHSGIPSVRTSLQIGGWTHLHSFLIISHVPLHWLLYRCINSSPPDFATFFIHRMCTKVESSTTSQFCYFLTRSYSQSKNIQAPPDFANLFSCLGLNGGKLKKNLPILLHSYWVLCLSKNVQRPPNFATFLLGLIARAGIFKHLPILLLSY